MNGYETTIDGIGMVFIGAADPEEATMLVLQEKDRLPEYEPVLLKENLHEREAHAHYRNTGDKSRFINWPMPEGT